MSINTRTRGNEQNEVRFSFCKRRFRFGCTVLGFGVWCAQYTVYRTENKKCKVGVHCATYKDTTKSFYCSQKRKMYVGVEFPDEDGGGVALIHTKWLTPRKQEVWWPPSKQRVSKALKKGESPSHDWRRYNITRIFFKEG